MTLTAQLLAAVRQEPGLTPASYGPRCHPPISGERAHSILGPLAKAGRVRRRRGPSLRSKKETAWCYFPIWEPGPNQVQLDLCQTKP